MSKTRHQSPRASARSTTRSLAAIVLAAGEGKRMKSRTAKVLHSVCGLTLVEHVVGAAISAGADPIVTVVGAQGEQVEQALRDAFPDHRLLFATQPERLGTADAVARARDSLQPGGARRRQPGRDVLILCGDVPALPASAMRSLVRSHRRSGASLSVLTAELDDPSGYGRIVRGPGGGIDAIVEQRDATAAQRAVREVNSGIYCARWDDLLGALEKVRPDNAQGEYYLTDAVRLLIAGGLAVRAVLHSPASEISGVNSRAQLSEAGRALNRRYVERLMDGGVTVIDPASTWIDARVRVGRDSVLHPGATLEGSTRLGRGCTVRSGVRLCDVVAGDDVTFLDHTVATDSTVGPRSILGPCAHLRPGSAVGPDCKVGNFVEMKKTKLGPGSKAPHLTYLGDAVIGRRVNVGAGTITCNYDGERKYETRLADGVFVGSDTQLIAPVSVGKGAYVAAGTTVTKDVPAGSLAIGRGPQKNIEGWVAKRKRRLKGPASS